MLKRKLLLADDSITIQKVVNLTFADEGIEVISVGDGDSAMEKVREYAPDLILADVNMPGLSGYQICEQIKQNAATQKIPVILLVGSFEPFDEAEAYRVGADDYLTKPFQSIRQLVTKVSDLLESVETAESETPIIEAAAEIENDAANVHFFNTVEIAPEKQIDSNQFGDTAMDDEMIQTSQIGSLPVDEIQKFIADSTAGISNAASARSAFNDDFDSYRNVEPEDDFGKTEPLDIEDLRAFTAEGVKETNGAVIYEIADDEADQNAVADQTDADKQFFTDQEMNLSGEIDVFDQEQIETEPSADSPVQTSPEPGAAFASPYFEAPDFLFDDLDLLELPPIARRGAAPENQLSVELSSEYQSENESAEQSAATGQVRDVESRAESVPIAENGKEAEIKTSAETEIDRQIAALSPELIDAIVRRVAEKMSDKAIREIAWEVVPQMTDLIVRRMAEEKLKE